MNCKMILLATAALVIVAAGVLVSTSDDSAAVTDWVSGGCIVKEVSRSDGGYDLVISHNVGAPYNEMDNYSSPPPWCNDADYIKAVIFDTDVENIGSWAFYGLKVAQINLPSSVYKIGEHAFAYSEIQSISLAHVSNIGEYAFENCTSLESVTIPATAYTVGRGVFMGCTSLHDVTIERGTLSLSAAMFADCTSLESVTIPASVTNTNGNGVFDGCTSLRDVTIEQGVKRLSPFMFRYCPIESITIPASVITIGLDTFQGCNLNEVLNLSSVDVSGNVGFENATIRNSIDAASFIEQSEYEKVVTQSKDDAASKMLLLIPVLVVVGIIAFLGVAVSRKYDLFD